MPKKDFYEVLGVAKSASADEIKKAYKRQARKHHPDRNSGNKAAEDRFKEVNEAYQTLSDAEKRKTYDRFGHGGPVGPGAPGYGPGYGQGPGPGVWREGPGGARVYSWGGGGGGPDINFEDFFTGEGARGGMGDLFSEMFTGARKRGGRGRPTYSSPHDFDFEAGQAPGQDVEAEITVSFDAAMRGGTQQVMMQKEGACAACEGTGRNKSKARTCAACGGKGKKQVANAGRNFTVVCQSCEGTGALHAEPCHVCSGHGLTREPETIAFNIPAGVKDGGRLRISGKGGAGPGGRRGDLYLRIHVSPHPYFRREGDDLHLDLPITMSEAGLGARIVVPTLDGKANLKIPAGTPSGAVLRLKSKGAPRPSGGGPGDLYVHVQIVAPTQLEDRGRQLLEELKKFETDPRAGKF